MARNNVTIETYNLAAEARKAALSRTLRVSLQSASDSPSAAFIEQYPEQFYLPVQRTAREQAATINLANFGAHIPDFPSTENIKEVCRKDGVNIAKMLFGNGAELATQPNSPFITTQNGYKNALQTINNKHRWILGTTMFFGYGGMLAGGIYAWCTYLPLINEGTAYIQRLLEQWSTGMHNNTLSQIDQWVIRHNLDVAEGMVIYNSNIIMFVSVAVGIGMGIFWMLKYPLNEWLTDSKQQALDSAVTSLTNTALNTDSIKQNALDADSKLAFIDRRDGKDLVNVIATLQTKYINQLRATGNQV